MTKKVSNDEGLDPLALLKALVSLRRLTGMYPAGHPAIEQKLGELDGSVQDHLRETAALKLDVIHGTAHLDGVSYRSESDSQAQLLHELIDPRSAALPRAVGLEAHVADPPARHLWSVAPSARPTGRP